MGGHTKGPWRVEEGTTLIWGACDPDDHSTYGMGYPITECRISPVSQSTWCKGPDCDEGEANARLIAAAPELLEALQDVLDIAETWAVLDGGKNIDLDASDTVKAARAAIAKALGQEGGAL